jgi:hypothetical protein
METATFESNIQSFLDLKKPSTKRIYTAGLTAFAEFYQPKGTIGDFLDRLEANQNKGWRQTENISDQEISDFVKWLKLRYKNKTVRSYVGAIQALAKKKNLPFSTRDCQLPVSNPDLKKYEWTIDKAVEFLNYFELPIYRSLGALIFQSFFDCSTALELTYGDIQKEYEKGVLPLCLDTERFKTGIPFMSFIGKWGYIELRKYLGTRNNIKATDRLFASYEDPTKPISETSAIAYFRRRAEDFLHHKFEERERNPCGTHSLRAGGSTLARNNITGDDEHVRAVDRYIDFFMGKVVAEEKRVYMSKSKEGWRQTWRLHVEPFVTLKTL